MRNWTLRIDIVLIMNGIAYSQNGGNTFCVRVFLYILFEDEVLNNGSNNEYLLFFPSS